MVFMEPICSSTAFNQIWKKCFSNSVGNLYNRNIFRTSLYIYIVQDEKCHLMRNLSLSMILPLSWRDFLGIQEKLGRAPVYHWV